MDLPILASWAEVAYLTMLVIDGIFIYYILYKIKKAENLAKKFGFDDASSKNNS